MKVDKNWVISFHKPTFNKPLCPGTWLVKLVYNDNTVLGQVKFLVIPQAYFGGNDAELAHYVANNNGPPAGLYSSDFVLEFDRDANDTKKLVQVFSSHFSTVGSELNKWIDTHVLHHWDLKATCVIADSDYNKCGVVSSCHGIEWSSRSPDPKSKVGSINENDRIG